MDTVDSVISFYNQKSQSVNANIEEDNILLESNGPNYQNKDDFFRSLNIFHKVCQKMRITSRNLEEMQVIWTEANANYENFCRIIPTQFSYPKLREDFDNLCELRERVRGFLDKYRETLVYELKDDLIVYSQKYDEISQELTAKYRSFEERKNSLKELRRRAFEVKLLYENYENGNSDWLDSPILNPALEDLGLKHAQLVHSIDVLYSMVENDAKLAQNFILSEESFFELCEVFDNCDQNHTGLLEFTELQEALRSLGYIWDPSEISIVIRNNGNTEGLDRYSFIKTVAETRWNEREAMQEKSVIIRNVKWRFFTKGSLHV